MLQSLTVTTLLCKAAITDCYGAVQLSPSSSAAVEVVDQLGHWGNYSSVQLLFQAIQAFLTAGGVACSDGLQARVNFWMSARDSIAQVSVNMEFKQLSSSLNH